MAKPRRATEIVEVAQAGGPRTNPSKLGSPFASGSLGAGRRYFFLTTWLLEAERERVWDAIYESETWPEWWRGVIRTERLADGDADGLGQVGRYTWRSRLPYELVFEMRTTRVDRPLLLEGEAAGELAGTGRWRLFEQPTGEGSPPVTAVVYEWNVATTRTWMNLLAPVARPIFQWNHDWVMRNGGTGLASLLGCRLIAAD
jgi:hypothetical protein